MVQLANHSTAANNGKWFRVLGVTASTITLPTASLTLNAVADTSFTLTVAKSIISPATPTEKYWTIDEYEQTTQFSTLGTDLKLCKIEIRAEPDSIVKIVSTWMGLDAAPQSTSATAVLTSPTVTTTQSLVMADGIIRIGGTDYAVLTGFSLTIDLGGQVPSVLYPTAPDVFLDNMKVSGSFTALRQDLTFLTSFRSETTVEFFLVFAENEADPKDFVSCYIANGVLNGADAQGLGNTGPRSVTVPWSAGKDDSGASDAATTTVKWAMSA
jgi:hypothetical protein